MAPVLFPSSRLLLLLLLLATAPLSCTAVTPPESRLGDTSVATELAARVAAHPELKELSLSLEVVGGVARLGGEVPTSGLRLQAEALARGIDGVRGVINEIEVVPLPPAEPTLADPEITARVRAKLAADPVVDPFAIEVATVGGVVTLTGRVADAADRSRVERLARETVGVRAVENLLELGDRPDG